MDKVVMLMPVYMLPNNRAANMKALSIAKDHYGVDEIVVNAQAFEDSDYVEGVTYIGRHEKGVGFARARNELLEWFYESDADWAVWLDGNGYVSASSLNDFETLMRAIRERDEAISKVDVICSTLSLMLSAPRILAKRQADYKEAIYLIDTVEGMDWFHGLFMRNLKKVYGLRLLMDVDCDPMKGTSEDVYFVRLLRRLFNCKLCPTMVVQKPSHKTSTWMSGSTGYKYPPLQIPVIDSMLDKYIREQRLKGVPKCARVIRLKRVEKHIDLLADYKPRPKVKSGGGLLK